MTYQGAYFDPACPQVLPYTPYILITGDSQCLLGTGSSLQYATLLYILKYLLKCVPFAKKGTHFIGYFNN